jgi:hypothetical protein
MLYCFCHVIDSSCAVVGPINLIVLSRFFFCFRSFSFRFSEVASFIFPSEGPVGMSCCKLGSIDFDTSSPKQRAKLLLVALREKSLCDDHLILLLRRLPSLFEMSRLMFDQNFIEEILSRSSHEQICDHVPVEEFLCAFLIEDSSEELLGMIWNVFLSNSRWDHLMSGLVERAKSEVVEGMSSGSNRLFVWLCCSQDKNDAVQMCLSVPAFWPMLSFWFRFSNNFTEEYAHSVAASLSKSLLEPTEDGRLDREKLRSFRWWQKCPFVSGAFSEEFVWKIIKEQERLPDAYFFGTAVFVASTLVSVQDRSNASTRLFSLLFEERITTGEIYEYELLLQMRRLGMLCLVEKSTIIAVLSKPVSLNRSSWSLFCIRASLLDLVPMLFSADLLIDWMKQVASTRADYEHTLIETVPLVVWQTCAEEACIMRVIEHAPKAVWAEHLANVICDKLPYLLSNEKFVNLQAKSTLWDTLRPAAFRYIIAGCAPILPTDANVNDADFVFAREVLWSVCGSWKKNLHLGFPFLLQQLAETVYMCLKSLLLKELIYKIIELATAPAPKIAEVDFYKHPGSLLAVYNLVQRCR